jgi:DNA-binding NtrC family response regulator
VLLVTASNQTATADASQLTEDGDERLAVGVQWVFPETRGTRVTWLSGGAQVVGRDAGCDTVLSGHEISRRHAELRRTGPVCVVRDLESKNGIFVNGQQVSSAAFTPGDVLRVGEWVGVAIRAAADEPVEVGELAPGLIGGVVLRRVVTRALAAARSPLPVALVGETGTGKERFAHAIHEHSGRSGPLLIVNCAGYSEALAAAQLFGHRKGAFTGAETSSPGHVRSADGGTLFLDEIAELPQAVQAQLLRVIEQGEVLPVGETKVLRVDLRFVCASQLPLSRLVEEKRFRADLRARLEGVRLELPPLRDRRSDIPHLAQAFLRRHSDEPTAIDSRLAEALCLRGWPLNVRELDLMMRRLLTLFAGERVLKLAKVASILDEKVTPSQLVPTARRRRPADEAQRAELDAALERCNGNLTKAAAEVGITRAKAYRLLNAKSSG